MYYSGIYKTIRDLEEKKFYDAALLFLSAKGYRELVIVDGSGDGGRDVTCNWNHIRIQLSVQKNWENKLNQEAKLAEAKGAKHFIYVTNRRIRDHEREDFAQNRYSLRGVVEITIHDLMAISTALSLPDIAESTRQVLDLPLSGKVTASPKEIAISNTLLFSTEARELRDNVIENSIRAHIFSREGISESELSHKVSFDLGSLALGAQVKKAIHRLRSKGEIIERSDGLYLNEQILAQIKAAHDDFILAKSKDVSELINKYSLTEEEADRLVKISLEILARNSSFDGDEPYAVQLTQFIATHNLQRRKSSLYDDLSKLTSARITEFGNAISHILATDTYDILRVLGRSSSITAILDSSVAMPMLFGLTFSHVRSRYGIGAAALSEMCSSHKIALRVPRPYLNEMANHGIKALEYIEIYKIIGNESRSVLRASGNAYLSHFGHIRDDESLGKRIEIEDFFVHFGLLPGATIRSVERRLEELLSNLGIEVINAARWEPGLRKSVLEFKPEEPAIIIDHDAAVLTLLTESSDSGYIFATWDRSLTELVERTSRVYADTPSRIVDFLSMAQGSDFESEQSVSLLDSLIYYDEKKAEALAKKIEAIRSTDRAFELQKFTDEARKQSPTDRSSVDIVEEFFSQTVSDHP